MAQMIYIKFRTPNPKFQLITHSNFRITKTILSEILNVDHWNLFVIGCLERSVDQVDDGSP